MTKKESLERRESISNVRYDIVLWIRPGSCYSGESTISFEWSSDRIKDRNDQQNGPEDDKAEEGIKYCYLNFSGGVIERIWVNGKSIGSDGYSDISGLYDSRLFKSFVIFSSIYRTLAEFLKCISHGWIGPVSHSRPSFFWHNSIQYLSVPTPPWTGPFQLGRRPGTVKWENHRIIIEHQLLQPNAVNEVSHSDLYNSRPNFVVTPDPAFTGSRKVFLWLWSWDCWIVPTGWAKSICRIERCSCKSGSMMNKIMN